MVSLILGSSTDLVQQLYDLHGEFGVMEFHADAKSLLARLQQTELPSAAVVLICLENAAADHVQMISEQISESPQRPRVIAVASEQQQKPAWADMLVRLPEQINLLSEIFAEAGSLSLPMGGRSSLERKFGAAQLKMQAILDNFAEGIALIDQSGIITRVNSKLLDTLGAEDGEDFIGQACHLALWGRSEPCPLCPRLENRTQSDDNKIIDRKGESRNLDVTANRLANDSGELIGVLETVRDATPRLKLEEHLIESEKMKAIGLVAAGLAHELRNPLAVISSVAECAREMTDNPESVEAFTTIMRATDNAEHVIRDLLNFVRPAPNFLMSIDPGDVIRSTLSMLGPRCKRQNVEVDLQVPPELPRVSADSTRLQQALLNFMLNGIDAMENGGTLSVCAHPQDDQIKITITDMGHGLSAEQLERVFEPFYSTKSNGVGLGMAISKNIILSHKGKIKIDSTVGRGTSIILTVPAETKTKQAQEIA